MQALLEQNSLQPNPLPITSSNLNERCETFIGMIKAECLSRLIVIGKRHLVYRVTEFTNCDNHHRAPVRRDHRPPIRAAPAEVDSRFVDQFDIRSAVSGLVRSFERKAALRLFPLDGRPRQSGKRQL